MEKTDLAHTLIFFALALHKVLEDRDGDGPHHNVDDSSTSEKYGELYFRDYEASLCTEWTKLFSYLCLDVTITYKLDETKGRAGSC